MLEANVGTILTIIAVILAIYGIVSLVRGSLLIGIGSIIAALLIGGGGIFAGTAAVPLLT